MPYSGHRILTWPGALVMVAAIFGAALGSVELAPQAGSVTSWYPAVGLSAGLLAIAPRRWWPALAAAVVVATGSASVLAGREVPITTAYAVGNGLEAIAAAAVLRHGRPAVRAFDSVESLVRLLLAAVAGGLTITAVAVVAATGFGRDEVHALAWTFFSSHAAAILIMVPAVVALVTERGPLRRKPEIIVQSVALLAVTSVVFWPDQNLTVSFAPLPFLVWAALRLQLRVLTCELVAFSIYVSLLGSHGGPFGYDYEAGRIDLATMGALVQGYLLCAVLLTLPLSAAVEQRRRLIRDLSQSEQLTNATLDTTAAMIMVVDLDGIVVRINQAVTALTGYGEREIVGRHIGDLPITPPGSSGFPAGLPDEPTGQVSRETGALTRSGERLQILWNTAYVHDHRGRSTYVVITGTDLTTERATATLNQRLLEAAVSTALIGLDPGGRITLYNAGAVHLLGHDAQDIVGHHFTELLDPTELEQCTGQLGPEAFPALVASLTQDVDQRRDWTWIGEDGRPHTVSMSLSVVSDAFAAQLGYLCVGRDVTEARASQELLVAALEKERVAVERLRALDAAKNEFVSTVSHELRTPVASIVGYTEMLQDGTVDEPTAMQRKLLDSIERSGRRLIALCEDLLTLGSLDSGATQWDREVVDLRELVEAAADAVRPLLVGRRLDVTFTATDPVRVLGDRSQLDRVLINLLSNAIKFTEDGGTIVCRADRHDAEAQLTVADTGIGVPEDEQDGMFERFFRSSTAQERAIQGTGLGLSIVASTVAAHGGRIEVESAHLEGTTITVRLPAMRS